MEGCWAAPLRNCGGGISHEHLVSKSVFPDQSIFVKGLDWCLEEPKEVHIESLTAKILCRDHNSALSELDSEAGRAFNTIREFAQTKTERGKMPYINWAFKQQTIDSRKLERWCLKTLLNFSFGRNLVIGPGPQEPGPSLPTWYGSLSGLKSSPRVAASTQRTGKTRHSSLTTTSATQQRHMRRAL